MTGNVHKGTEFANVKETWEQNEKNQTGKGTPDVNRSVQNEPLRSDFWQKEKEEIASANQNKGDEESKE